MTGPLAFVRRVVVVASTFGIAGIVLATPASAHAVLESSTPADGANVAQAPSEVTLEFSENLRAPADAVRVLDAAGTRVDTGKVKVEGHVVHATLKPSLPDGAYIVSWRVISADSHPVRGAFTFAIGTGAVADSSALASVYKKGADRPLQVAGALARGAAYLGALLAAGGALYLALIEEEPPASDRARRLVLRSAGLGAAGILVGLVIQADLSTGLGLGALFSAGGRADALAAGVGLSTAITLAGLVGLGLALRLAAPARRVALVVGGVAAVAGFAAAGHTTQATPKWLATTADVVHVAAGAAWIGGLVLLLLALVGRGDDDPAATGRIVARFSVVATIAILSIGASGLALGWGQVRSFHALTATTYGKLLLVKVAVVALIAAVGAFNKFVLVPAVSADPPSEGSKRLRRAVRAEVGGLLGVIALTAVLVNVTPAANVVTGPYSTTAPFGTGSVKVVVDPPRAGATTLDVYLRDTAGKPRIVAPTQGVVLTVELSLPSADLGPLVRTPVDAGGGHYRLSGNDLSLTGRWTVTIRLRLSQFFDETGTVDVPIK